MNATLSPGMIVTYLIYGMAFISLGTILMLESGRAPRLDAARVLLPLAVFGWLHGVHEWMELFLQLSPSIGWTVSVWVQWVRIGLLVLSFLSLVAYGIQVLYPPQRLVARDTWVGLGLLCLYMAGLALIGSAQYVNMETFLHIADLLARYTLGVPGALLTAFALRHRARHLLSQNHDTLARGLGLASISFFLYAGTQLMVSHGNWGLTNWLNAQHFFDAFGVRVEVIRTVLALATTMSLLHAMQAAENERQLEMAAAQQARVQALERVQQELSARETMRKELLRHTVTMQEEERKRISRELHDETAQSLTAFSFHLAALQNTVIARPEILEQLEQLQKIGGQMALRIQRLVHDLRPAQLDDLGLIPALQYLTEDTFQRLGLQAELVVPGGGRRVDPVVETVIFRLVQEALTNITRHAQTSWAEVVVEFHPQEVLLSITDQGVGFELAEAPATDQGWGLVGMRERVEAVGGTFEIQTAPGQGTHIRASLPVTA